MRPNNLTFLQAACIVVPAAMLAAAAQTIPHGCCHCGCGQKTGIALYDRPERGITKGDPVRFVPGHNRKAVTLDSVFWNHVDAGSPDQCWEWRGTLHHGSGYGRLKFKGKLLYAHRVSYELHYGQLDRDLCACHTCDNRICVNPHHLFAATRAENNDDKLQKQRQARGEKIASAKLTPDAIQEIRELRKDGMSGAEIAARYGITRSHANAICRADRWGHVS